MSSRVLTGLVLVFSIAGLLGSTPIMAQSTCSFNGKLKISPENIVSDSEPVRGNPSASVLMVEFFDPNCHPCGRLHPVIKDVVEKYGDQIRFYMHPVPVWRYSGRQIESLILAKQRGKYYEMIDYQLRNQQKGGLSVDQIAELADSAGIDPDWMRKQLTAQDRQKQVARLSFQAQRAGVKNTPTLAIGRRIISSRQPTSCIGELVRQAVQDASNGTEGGR